jgi:hypothetical protein
MAIVISYRMLLRCIYCHQCGKKYEYVHRFERLCGEASVVANRSVSIWRLQPIRYDTTQNEVAAVIDALLELAPVDGPETVKGKGLAVLRVRVRFQLNP